MIVAPNEPEAVVGEDLSCIACLYNLRGRPVIGVCPECGVAIADSLDPRRLDRADPHWVGRVRRGVAFIGAAYVAPVALLGIAGVLSGSLRDAITAIGVAAMALCFGLGAWLLSTHEPPHDELHPRPRRRPRLLESCVRTAGVILAITLLAFDYMVTFHTRAGSWLDWLPTALTVAGVLLGVTAPVLTRRLLRRTPGRPETAPTWLDQAATAISWGILCVGVSSNLLDRQPEVLLLALALFVVPPAVAARAWWAMRVAQHPAARM